MDAANIVIIVVVIVIALGSWFIWDKRYKGNPNTRIPEGYEPTEEAFIDPTNGKKYSVYYSPETGERYYQETK